MKDQQPESEASMEEILSSIRQIISADAGNEKKSATATTSTATTGGPGVVARTAAPTTQPMTHGPNSPVRSDSSTLPTSKAESSSTAPAEPAKKEDDGDDVLVLTEVVEKDGRVVSLDSAKTEAPSPSEKTGRSESATSVAAAPKDAPSPITAKAEPKPMADLNPIQSKSSDELVSSDAAKATSKSLNQLADTIAEHQAAKDSIPEMPLAPGSTKTMEDIVRELMRPMLKEWLDENLPGVVERVVRKEVQKLVRQVED